MNWIILHFYNSASRVSACCYMETLAICNYNNFKTLLNPIYDELKLLKENTCILLMNNTNKWFYCALECDVNYKKELDQQWTLTNNVIDSEYDTYSLKECEILKRRGKWQLMNHNIQHLHVSMNTRMKQSIYVIC